MSEPQSDLVPIGPGRWEGPGGRLYLQAYDGDGRPMVDGAGNPIVEPSSTGMGLEPVGQQVAPPPIAPEPPARRRSWLRRAR
ncbi:MAG: hypothetical protein JWN61_555 [Pseudonocardiales bacterium]|nr:hypothetical protein [Pseudonocardiales bacterium]